MIRSARSRTSLHLDPRCILILVAMDEDATEEDSTEEDGTEEDATEEDVTVWSSLV